MPGVFGAFTADMDLTTRVAVRVFRATSPSRRADRACLRCQWVSRVESRAPSRASKLARERSHDNQCMWHHPLPPRSTPIVLDPIASFHPLDDGVRAPTSLDAQALDITHETTHGKRTRAAHLARATYSLRVTTRVRFAP